MLHPDSEGDKLPGAEFKNVYETVKPKPTDPNTPQTGDEYNPVLYAVLVAVSLAVIVTLFLTRKSRKTEE